MIDTFPSKQVLHHYPDARLATFYVEAFLAYTRRTLEIGPEKIAFLTSICSDDLNSVGIPKTGMIGPFVQGGLDGYPFVGRTGIGAFSHHLPDGGAAMMFVGPHVGITQAGQVGMVMRPGQAKATTCCGAAAEGLRKLEAGEIKPKEPREYVLDDFQQETLEQMILRHKAEIEAAGRPGEPDRFIRMSELLYRDEMTAFRGLLVGAHFGVPAFLFGGIVINEDAPREAAVSLEDVGLILNGKYQDLTDNFKEFAEPKFKELQEGKRNAFR